MGYRSYVEIRIAGPRDVVMGAIAGAVLQSPSQIHIQEALKAYRVIQHPTRPEQVIAGFTGEHVKWYADYPDVQAIESIWRACEGFEGVDTAFVRIGEENEDIETHYSGDDPYDLAVAVRSIEACSLEGVDIRETPSSKIDSSKTEGESG